jgi:hypothetical protein
LCGAASKPQSQPLSIVTLSPAQQHAMRAAIDAQLASGDGRLCIAGPDGFPANGMMNPEKLSRAAARKAFNAARDEAQHALTISARVRVIDAVCVGYRGASPGVVPLGSSRQSYCPITHTTSVESRKTPAAGNICKRPIATALGDNPHDHGKTPRFLRDNPQSAHRSRVPDQSKVANSAADSAPKRGRVWTDRRVGAGYRRGSAWLVPVTVVGRGVTALASASVRLVLSGGLQPSRHVDHFTADA